VTDEATEAKPKGRPRGARRFDVSASVKEWGPILENLDRARLPVQLPDAIASLSAGAYLGVPAKALGLQHGREDTSEADAGTRLFGQKMSVKSPFASRLYLCLIFLAQVEPRIERSDYGSFNIYPSDLSPTNGELPGVHVSLFRTSGSVSRSGRMALNLMLGETGGAKSFLRKFQRAWNTLIQHDFIRSSPKGRGRGSAKRSDGLPKLQFFLTERDRVLRWESVKYQSRGMNSPHVIPVPIDLVSRGWLAVLDPKDLITLLALGYQRISTPLNVADGTPKSSWFLSADRRNQCGLSEETYRKAHQRLVEFGLLQPLNKKRYEDKKPQGPGRDKPHEFLIVDGRLTDVPST